MRTVIVAGVGRCGTSAMAGVCYHLGVHMGDDFFPADHNNPYGTFEEIVFYNLNRSPRPGRSEYNVYARWRESLGHDPWGVKDPALLQFNLLDEFASVLDDAHVINMVRAREAVIASFQRAYNKDYIEAVMWYQNAIRNAMFSFSKTDAIVLDINYDRLVDHTEDVVREVADFIFDEAPDLEKAIAHVREDGRNFRSNGTPCRVSRMRRAGP